MCIRDSYSYYLGERNISVLPLNVYDPPERFIAYIKKNRENPVSYTHLDVYKRQVLRMVSECTATQVAGVVSIRLALIHIYGSPQDAVTSARAVRTLLSRQK